MSLTGARGPTINLIDHYLLDRARWGRLGNQPNALVHLG
jgi:hypothetical protein